MLQRWHEISFLHWSCDPSCLRGRLPQDLEVDTCDEKAWISLTPFVLVGLRPPLIPRAWGFVFPEMNLRTYVIGPAGPGIWFFSLEAGRRLAVIGARLAFGLPYYYAEMNVNLGGEENAYWSRRRDGTSAMIKIKIEDPIVEQSDLDLFLTDRRRLYSTLFGRLTTVAVHHPSWKLNCVRVLQLEENVRRTMVVDFPSEDFLAHHSSGVDVRIEPPRGV
jgi:uncharacterized protein